MQRLSFIPDFYARQLISAEKVLRLNVRLTHIDGGGTLPPGGCLRITPVTLKEARHFVGQHHRHHRPPQGALFAVAASNEDAIVGVAIVGRPVARMLDNGLVAEITRLCTIDGAPMGTASKLYARAGRIAQLLGYERVISYILVSETGISLKAANWIEVGLAGGGSWDTPSRPRVDTHPLEQKTLWEAPGVGRITSPSPAPSSPER